MELAVICQRQLIAAHAVKWPSVNDIPPVTKMLAEVSRVLVQVQAWLPEGTLQRAWVVGEDADVGELPDALSQRWKCPVQRFDSWRDNHFPQSVTKFEGSASQYAIAGGLALIQSASLTPKIDLLHPRQPPPKRDPRKPIIAAVSAAALLTAVLGFSGIQLGLSSYDYAINELKEQDNRQKKDLTAGGPVFVASQALQDWQARNINQLQQMNELYQLMNGTKREVIADYRFDPAPGEVLGKLTANGNAKDRSDAEQLQQRLADLPKYRVRPKPTNQSTRDADYSSRFELDIDLRSETKSAKTAKPATVVPKASNTE